MVFDPSRAIARRYAVLQVGQHCVECEEDGGDAAAALLLVDQQKQNSKTLLFYMHSCLLLAC